MRREYLDGDDAIEASVAGAINLSHAAGADGGLNLVRSEPISRNECHELGDYTLGRQVSWGKRARTDADMSRLTKTLIDC